MKKNNLAAAHPETLRDDVRPADADAVRAIIAATGVFSDEEIDVAGELVEETLRRDEGDADLDGYRFVFLEQAGELLGYACYGRIPLTAHSYDLYWIAVDPDYQGAGYARLLMNEVADRVQGLDGHYLFAETSGLPQYQPARTFYAAMGYGEAAVIPDFYKPGDAKYIYRKKI